MGARRARPARPEEDPRILGREARPCEGTGTPRVLRMSVQTRENTSSVDRGPASTDELFEGWPSPSENERSFRAPRNENSLSISRVPVRTWQVLLTFS